MPGRLGRQIERRGLGWNGKTGAFVQPCDERPGQRAEGSVQLTLLRPMRLARSVGEPTEPELGRGAGR